MLRFPASLSSSERRSGQGIGNGSAYEDIGTSAIKGQYSLKGVNDQSLDESLSSVGGTLSTEDIHDFCEDRFKKLDHSDVIPNSIFHSDSGAENECKSMKLFSLENHDRI
jgi:hypothetical protein